MELNSLLQRLSLLHLAMQLDTVCEQAAKRELDLRAFLAEALACEWRGRHQKAVETRLAQSRFPWIKTLEQYDFDFQPAIDRRLMREMATLAFVERAENVVFLGPPGVGKTHLAIALGYKAIEAGHRVLFLTLDELMTRLRKAQAENRLDKVLQQLTYPKLLILDEIGYLPLSRQEASLLFRLISRRYERASMILTSNKGFVDWGEIFGDHVLATAILDRLLHHATTFNIKGESYRLRERKKAGLIQHQPQPTQQENDP